MNRRGFLAASIGTASVAALGDDTAQRRPGDHPSPAPPEPLGALLNRERATRIMREAHLDALLLTSPLNVYYATNAVPVLSRFSTDNTAFAVVPADPARPIGYITDGFEYYAGSSDSALAPDVKPYLAGGGFASTDPRTSPAFPYIGNYTFDARERLRRDSLERAAPFRQSVSEAASQALLDLRLSRAVIGVDTAYGAALLQEIARRATSRPASDLMLHVRLVKTPAELKLMRRAAANNVEASIATAAATREVQGIWALRQRFYQEAAARGNLGVYGSIDLVMSELADGTFREGQCFMIDFVSQYGFYQGDFGRTVSYGEPDPQMRKAVDIGISAWREIRERLKPGLKFSEIHAIGERTVKAMGAKFLYAFHPHSVGLQHWDQPLKDIQGGALDLPLESGMILSVDCPLLNAGVNGTTHIEDLVLINDTASEMIHREYDGLIRV
jgi:Xaa-Pro aminopeptidase